MTKRLAAPPACWTKCFWPVVHVSKMGCGKVSRFSASDSNSWTGFGGSNLLEGILTKGMTMSSRGCNRVLTGEDDPLEVLDVFIVEILPVWVAYMHMMWTFYTTPWQKQPHHITIKEMFDILLRNEVAERLYEPIDSTCQLSQRPGNTRPLQKWDLVYSHNNLFWFPFALPLIHYKKPTNHNLKFSTLVSFNSTWAYLLRTGGTIAVWCNEKPKAFKHSESPERDLLSSKKGSKSMAPNHFTHQALIVFVLFGRSWWDRNISRGRHPKKKKNISFRKKAKSFP